MCKLLIHRAIKVFVYIDEYVWINTQLFSPNTYFKAPNTMVKLNAYPTLLRIAIFFFWNFTDLLQFLSTRPRFSATECFLIMNLKRIKKKANIPLYRRPVKANFDFFLSSLNDHNCQILISPSYIFNTHIRN